MIIQRDHRDPQHQQRDDADDVRGRSVVNGNMKSRPLVRMVVATKIAVHSFSRFPENMPTRRRGQWRSRSG